MIKREYLFLIILIPLLGCNVLNPNDGLKDKIVGSWVDELYEVPEKNLIVDQEYFFTDKNTFLVAVKYFDSERNFLGYTGYNEGEYQLDDNSLTFSREDSFFSEEEELFDSIEKMRLEDSTSESEVQITYKMDFSDNYNTLKLIFDCPFNASCAPYPVLRRIDE